MKETVGLSMEVTRLISLAVQEARALPFATETGRTR